MKWSAVLGACCGLTLVVGCGEEAFPGSAPTLDSLGRGVLEAFQEGDREALAAFLLSEDEHNDVIWPELPAAQGESPYPVDLAWQNIELRNQRSIPRASQALERAVPRAFDSVVCEGETRAFETFSVQTDCYTRFTYDGTLYRVQLFKDVLVRNGGYKIFRYYDEDPERVVGGA